MQLTVEDKNALITFGKALIDQEQARVIVAPNRSLDGFWFGGGNLVAGPDGALYLVGRYRNYGDSRIGMQAGERGLALTIFRSVDQAQSFQPILTLTKADLSRDGHDVLSIEGTALRFTPDGVELFLSSEKRNLAYPESVSPFHKPGTGVWTIERMTAETVEGLTTASIKTVLDCRDPRWLHVKDPFLQERPNGELLVGFVTHPYSWASSNSGYALRPAGSDRFSEINFDFFRRGFTWDIAISRLTAWLPVPRVGRFATKQPLTLLFYDGGESMRDLDAHKAAVDRPRGYSCEEIGGLAVADGSGVAGIERLSVDLPLFTSPQGSGCSRYVDVLETADGFYATWQQSQADGSQPLVLSFLSREAAEPLLT